MSTIVDASIATALISPDPLSISPPEDCQDTTKKRAEGSSEKPIIEKASPVTVDERFYAVDSEKLQKLREDKPWAKPDNQQQQQAARQQAGQSQSLKRPMAKYFESISLSPSAVTKMMMHCQSGVQKGIQQGGNPIEVMGLLLGRPDPHKPTNLIVTDAFPLPIEGFETRVVADDQAVINHMISLGECLERTRREKFMGWYHSHPFDLVESRSHCFLSQTDLSTQLQWQRAEDPHGNPFCAIVVDPLRSMHLQTPQLKAFRAYPPEYTSPVLNECPDGSIVESEKLRLEKWGSCWNRYYELSVEYYMSAASRSILGDLTQQYLWIQSFHRESVSEEGGAASGSQAAKVETLRSIANQSSSVARNKSAESAAIGGTSGGSTIPISKNATTEVVEKLQSNATEAMIRQSVRNVHTKIFANLSLGETMKDSS